MRDSGSPLGKTCSEAKEGCSRQITGRAIVVVHLYFSSSLHGSGKDERRDELHLLPRCHLVPHGADAADALSHYAELPTGRSGQSLECQAASGKTTVQLSQDAIHASSQQETKECASGMWPKCSARLDT